MEAVANAPEKLKDKIAYLLERKGLRVSDLSKIAHVTHQAAANYLSGAMPGAPALRDIAHSFDVSMDDYLLNDEQPVERPVSALEATSDEALILEAARRYAAADGRMHKLLKGAESIDWEKVGEAIGSTDDEQWPAQVVAAVDLAKALHFIIRNTVDQFDSVAVARKQLGLAEPAKGDTDNGRSRWFFSRIDAIYDRLTTPPGARGAFMASLQRHVLMMDDPEQAFALAEGALQRYHAAINS